MKNVKLWQMVSTIHLSITRWGCFGWPTEHGSMLTKLIAAIGNTAVFVLHVCAVAMAAKRIREYLSVESPHLLKTLRPVFKLGFFSQTFFRSNNIGFLRNREGKMDQSTVLSPNLSSNPKDHWTLQCQTLYVSGVHVFPQNRQFWGVLGYLGNTKLGVSNLYFGLIFHFPGCRFLIITMILLTYFLGGVWRSSSKPPSWIAIWEGEENHI